MRLKYSKVDVMETMPLEQLYATLPTSGRRSLQSYLGNVERGFDELLTTPFFKGEINNPKKYGMWYFENIAKSGIPELDELELDEVDTFTPMSVRKPWSERRQDASAYFVNKEFSLPSQTSTTWTKIARLIPKSSVVPLSFKASFGAMPKDSNLGLPWFTRNKDVLYDYLERARSLQQHGYDQDLYPAVVGWRGQSSGDPIFPKQRVVWMEDHLETIIGLSIQVPLLERLRKFKQFMAWGTLDGIDKGVTSLMDSTRKPIMSADYSGFDKRVPRILVLAAFDLIRYWFSREAWPQIDWLEDQILHVGLVTPDGVYVNRNGGIPSGSSLTNLLDSLIQLLMLDPTTLATVLGDDGIYLDIADPDELSARILDQFGMVVSTDKGGFDNSKVRYLQRLHLKSYRKHGICVGIRSLVRTWRGACYLERYTPDLPPEFFSARTITQLENSKHHPKFKDAVSYFFEIDEVLHRLDPMEVFRAAGGVEFVEKTLGLDSYKFGSELPSTGLNTFDTVRELRRIRGSMKAA